MGLQFNNCCWAVRVTANDRLTNNDINDRKQAIYVELELTGLGRIGTGIFDSDD